MSGGVTGTHVLNESGKIGDDNARDLAILQRGVFVDHGSTAGTARPSSSVPVKWFGTVAPTNAITNDEWYDRANEILKRYDGSAWQSAGSATYALKADAVSLDQLAFGAGNSPQGVLANPSLGPNLWDAATSGLGAGFTTAASFALTANSTNQETKKRIKIGDLPILYPCIRFTWDLSSAILDGWPGLFYEWLDSGHSVIGSRQFIYGGGFATLTNWKGVLDLAAPVGAVDLQIGITMLNNSTAGTMTVNSGDLRRVAYARPPVVSGKAADTTPRVTQPITDPATPLTNGWFDTWFGTDGALTAAVAQGSYYDTASTWQQSPVSGTGSQSNPCPTMTLVGTQNQIHVGNAGHVMGIINASSAQELRCNAHGGETGRSGVDATDFKYEYDVGDGVWLAWQNVTNLAHFGKRFRLTQQTKVTATTGELVAWIDYTWTYFDDGSVRHSRTTTFKRSQAMYMWFVWMSSMQPGGSAGALIGTGRIGAGDNVHGAIDFRPLLTTPVIASVTTSGSGGVLPAATKNYRLTRRSVNGETLPSAAVAVTSTGTTSKNTVTFPASITGQTGWGVYDDNGRLAYVPVAATTYDDTGAVGAGSQPPTANNAWYTATTFTSTRAESSSADWMTFRHAPTGVCFAKAIDRAEILAAHPSSVAVRGQMIADVSTTITKQYFHLEGPNGGALPSGTQANGLYPVTIPNGTAITVTAFDFRYLPASTDRYELELGRKTEDVSALVPLYPAT